MAYGGRERRLREKAAAVSGGTWPMLVRGPQRRTGQRICYPCQTCLPQAHRTVSVGFCLVSCCLQIGQGLVITYVIAVTSQDQGSIP